MAVCSSWKITYDADGASPLVLVDYGGLLADELAFPTTQANQPRGGLRVLSRGSFGRGGVTSEFSFSVLREWDNHAAAREWCIDHNAAFLALTLAQPALEIQVQNGRIYRWPAAPWVSVSPSVSLDNKSRILTRCDYRIDAGAREPETSMVEVFIDAISFQENFAPYRITPGAQGRWEWRFVASGTAYYRLYFAGNWRIDLVENDVVTGRWQNVPGSTGAPPMFPWDITGTWTISGVAAGEPIIIKL